MRGRRTSLTRHQTLGATLDWSYQLLPEAERAALRGVAIFAGVFTWNSASVVLRKDDADLSEIFDSIANLVAKSLVSATVGNGVSFYRLLDTTRAYALLKLEESGQRNDQARRHDLRLRNARNVQITAQLVVWRQSGACTTRATLSGPIR